MPEPDLGIVCLVAFSAVFVLLAILAWVMHLITLMFHREVATIEQAHIAVISSTYQALIPGSKVTRIEEIK